MFILIALRRFLLASTEVFLGQGKDGGGVVIILGQNSSLSDVDSASYALITARSSIKSLILTEEEFANEELDLSTPPAAIFYFGDDLDKIERNVLRIADSATIWIASTPKWVRFI